MHNKHRKTGRQSEPDPLVTACHKTQYSKREAVTALNHRLRGKGRPEHLRVYHCPLCNHWHLTSQEKNQS